MKNETRERNKEIYQMYVQGFTGGKQYSMSEIAEIYGLTKQRISAIIISERKKLDCATKRQQSKRKSANEVIYPAIRDYLIEHELSLNQWLERLDLHATQRHTVSCGVRTWVIFQPSRRFSQNLI